MRAAVGRGGGGDVDGWVRADGRAGVRNHVLVLPSVVCSTHAAQAIGAAEEAVFITHQHGCLHVGDDLRHTEHELAGTATNPNVGGVVVVSLGCETIRGKRLARRIADQGQRVELVGIQAAGGTSRAVEEGRAAVGRLRDRLADDARTALDPGALIVGLDRTGDALTEPLAGAFGRRGWRTVPAPDGLSAAESHVALAGEGAQVIVSLRGAGEAPLGFAVCPVVAVARDAAAYAALHDDFDVEAAGGDPDELAEVVAGRVAATAAGEPTASERRGARDFVLRRLAVTM